MKNRQLIKIEQFNNTILRYYSDGSLYQTFLTGITWKLI